MTSQSATAVEPVERFVQRLRERGYFDIAMDYLQSQRDNKSLPENVRQSLDYHQGVTLTESAKYQRDLAVRSKTLDQASGKLDSFLANHPEHEFASTARDELRRILMLRARMALAAAKQSDDAQAYEAATSLYGEAVQAYQQHRERLKESIQAKRKNSTDGEAEGMQTRYVETVSQAALLQFEMASAEQDRKKREQILVDAEAAFAEIAKKYRSWGAGLQAVYFQGRCQQEQGNLKEALSFFERLCAADERDETTSLGKALATQALESSIQCWTDDEIGEIEKAVTEGEAWRKIGEPANSRDPVWQGFLLTLAKAHLQYADQLTGIEQGRAQTDARKLLNELVRRGGPKQQEARQALASLTGGDEPVVDDTAELPKTFTEAHEAARVARERMQNADVKIQLLTPKLATADANEEAGISKALDDARRTSEQSRSRALTLHALAIRLAGADVGHDQLNELRYYLAYIFHTSDRFHEAAVLSEFVARKFPNHAVSRQCANIALASYLKLYAEESVREYAIRHVIAVSDYIVRTWPQQKEGADALVTLVTFMIQDGQWEKAEEFLDKIPNESPRRADAELRLGQAIWGHYLNGMRELRERESEGANVSTSEREALDRLKQRSQEVLSTGIRRLQDQPPTAVSVRAALSLAQVYVNSGLAAEAIELLEDPNIGPKTLADEQHAVSQSPGMTEQIYKTTLQAYIASLPKATSRQRVMQKATAVMQSLEKAAGKSDVARGRLTAVYVSLAKDLRSQIELAPVQQRAVLSAGFDAFLSSVQQGTSDLNILAWVGETYFNLAQGLDNKDSGPTAQAKPYYEKASQAYERMLSSAASDKLEPNLSTKIQMQLANIQRQTGDFQSAIENFEKILKQKNGLFNVQIAAARTYQDGAKKGQKNWFDLAIQGSGGRKPTIWGWGKIAKIAAAQMFRSPDQKERYRDTFHEARYNIARCRYDQALVSQGDERKKSLQRARKAITTTSALYPDLGGDLWKTKYERLLKDIERVTEK